MPITQRAVITIFFLTSCARPQISSNSIPTQETAIDRAVVAAQILPADSLETKVQKALKLINQDRYYYPKGPAPKLAPPFDQPYHLDSQRTPEQILEQEVGGYCASAALVFSAILMKAGVQSGDMRIVAAVKPPMQKLSAHPHIKRERRIPEPEQAATFSSL